VRLAIVIAALGGAQARAARAVSARTPAERQVRQLRHQQVVDAALAKVPRRLNAMRSNKTMKMFSALLSGLARPYEHVAVPVLSLGIHKQEPRYWDFAPVEGEFFLSFDERNTWRLQFPMKDVYGGKTGYTMLKPLTPADAQKYRIQIREVKRALPEALQRAARGQLVRDLTELQGRFGSPGPHNALFSIHF
jgi:hypothetical protein